MTVGGGLSSWAFVNPAVFTMPDTNNSYFFVTWETSDTGICGELRGFNLSIVDTGAGAGMTVPIRGKIVYASAGLNMVDGPASGATFQDDVGVGSVFQTDWKNVGDGLYTEDRILYTFVIPIDGYYEFWWPEGLGPMIKGSGGVTGIGLAMQSNQAGSEDVGGAANF